MTDWPARYIDSRGEIATTIRSDGRSLRMSLEGVDFAGPDFDALEPTTPSGRFSLVNGCLAECTLRVGIDVLVIAETNDIAATLHVDLTLGRAAHNGGLDHENLRLELAVADLRIPSRASSGYFEDELADIRRALPPGWHLKTCFGCAHSDYSPYGHGLFGWLHCFRDNKAGYARVRSKEDLFVVLDTATETVQETYLCPEFAVRAPGTGYRG